MHPIVEMCVWFFSYRFLMAIKLHAIKIDRIKSR